jgi:hypothetical protein
VAMSSSTTRIFNVGGLDNCEADDTKGRPHLTKN